MESKEEELKKFIREVYKILEQNKNESDNTKISEIKKYIERKIQS